MTNELPRSRQAAHKPAPVADPTLMATSAGAQADQIGRTLLALYGHHALLTVHLPESSETFTSAILEVDSKKHYLLLDELFPREGHELVSRGMPLGMGARLGGAPISFESIVVEIGTESDVAFYKLPFPHCIDCDEQRRDRRVRVAFAYNIPVYVWADVNHPFQGKLYDLSTNGLGMRLERAAESTLASDRTEFTCVIQFPNGENIRTVVEVCAVSPRKLQPHIKVGGRFVGLSEKDQRTIDRFIADADRAQVNELRR